MAMDPGATRHRVVPPKIINAPLTLQSLQQPMFLPPVSYGLGGAYAEGIAVADLNHDGRVDLVVASLCTNTNNCPNVGGEVSVLLGNGDGTFQNSTSYSSGGVDAQAVVVADVNGDGNPDILVANRCVNAGDCTGSVGVMLGNGDGSFQPAVNYRSGGQSAWSIAVADVNHDGKLDVVLSNSDSLSVSVLLGKGDGTFGVPLTYGTGGYYSAPSVAVADVNLDGKLDILVVDLCRSGSQCDGPGAVGVLLGNGDGTFQPVVVYDPGGDNSIAVISHDLNGDGKPDLIVANTCGKDTSCVSIGTVGVLLGNGDGTFQTAVSYSAGVYWPRSVAVSDVNKDGALDLVVASYNSGIAILLGNGDGTFQPAVVFNSTGDTAQAQGLAVADLNGDGWPDLLASSFSSNLVGVLMNDLGPHGPTTTSLTSTVNPVGVAKSVTYTASVSNQSGSHLTGTITFQDAGTTIATVTLAGNQASYAKIYKQIGSHSITAIYSGDAENSSSNSQALVEYVQGGSRTVLATSGSPSKFGQPVTFTATVTSPYGKIPDGETVTFYTAGKSLASVPLSGGKAAYTTSTLTVGMHAIKATYQGDNNFKTSSGWVTQVVEQ
jgi:Bacterial Ig-like domain (group 3)/FG-GAP-like repeat